MTEKRTQMHRPGHEDDKPRLLSEHDPPSTGTRSGPPVLLVALILIVVIAFVVLHLTGILGPESH
jgi:hypothetical protein